jgi:F-type H+-transporting ATPase subunit b
MESLLKPDMGLMIFTIVTFLLLVAMLKKFAWKPILEALEGRETKIRSDVERAEKANADAEALRQQYQAQLVEAQKNIQSMVAQAKADGERLRADLVGQAKAEAESALEKGRRDLSNETERLRGELRKEVASLSVNIAEKILQRAVDPKVQEAVLADALKSMGKNQ